MYGLEIIIRANEEAPEMEFRACSGLETEGQGPSGWSYMTRLLGEASKFKGDSNEENNNITATAIT